MTRKRLLVLARRLLAPSIAALVLLTAACTQQRVNEAEIGVHYTDGWIEGQHFESVLEPGDSAWVYNDHIYKLPARQITWIAGPGGEADTPALEFNAQGGERMVMELTTRFVLNTTLDDDQQPFKDFFTGICQKFDCWEGAIGGTDPEEGWNRMLRELVGNPQQAALNQLGLRYEGEALRYDNETRRAFAAEFADAFETLLTDEADVTDIFCGPTYVRGEEDCPPIEVRVTNVTFKDAEREGIREAEVLAREQERLATAQEAAAHAQQRVVAAQATPEYERQAQADAVRECASNPECSLTIVITGDTTTVQPSIPVG